MIKNMAGLKESLLKIKNIFRTIWSGDPKKKAEKRSNFFAQLDDEEFLCDEMNKERRKIKKYKKTFEKYFWKENEPNFSNGELSDDYLKDSDVDGINLAVLKWYRERWFSNPKNSNCKERIQFYLWLENTYISHLKKYSKNKKDHFNIVKQQSHNKSIRKSISFLIRILVPVGGILYINIWQKLEGIFKYFISHISKYIKPGISENTLTSMSFIIVLVLGIIIMFYLFHILYKEKYIEEIAPQEKKRETWVRHVKAIQAYQKIILEYLEDIGNFSYYKCPDDKDILFMSQILDIWGNNAERFQENMRKEPKGL